MRAHTQYSPYFLTIHEEMCSWNNQRKDYSVMRALYDEGSYFHFLIQWDEDEDERIIPVLEELYLNRKLLHYIIVGERKGNFYAILPLDQEFTQEKDLLEVDGNGDPWNAHVGSLHTLGSALLKGGEPEVIVEAFSPIITQWQLGQVHSEPNGILELKRCRTNLFFKNRHVKFLTEGKCGLFGFPYKAVAAETEVRWQKKTTDKFFRAGKIMEPGKRSFEIYAHIRERLDTNSVAPFVIDNCCRRSFVIALSKILTEREKMPSLRFQLGPTLIEFQESPETSRRRQRGNFKMSVPAYGYDIAYGDNCTKNVDYLMRAKWDNDENADRRKDTLFEKMRTRLQTMIPFTTEDFNVYGNIFIGNERAAQATDKNALKNAHFLNALLMLITTVEVLVRFYREPNGEIFPYDDATGKKSDSFPVALAQTRSLLLLLGGKISFADFIGQSKIEHYDAQQHRAFYGLVTGKKTMDNLGLMLTKLLAINDKFNADVLHANLPGEPTIQYLRENAYGTVIAGRSQMALELKSIYGSGSESEEEDSGYSDEADPIDEKVRKCFF